MKRKHYKILSIFFMVLGTLSLIGLLIDAQCGEYYLGYKGSEIVVILLCCISFICLILMLSFIKVSGGTVEHIGQGVRAEFPPKIISPTISTKVICPFECCCEKHHGSVHEGIDIAPQTPEKTGDPVFAVTKGRVYTDKEEGIVRLECNMFTIIYRHLETITCQEGAKVKPGDIIGTMGGKDTEEGVYLHIEFWNNQYSEFVDPVYYFDWGTEKEEKQEVK